jgi:hypothetical protein
VLFSVVDPDRHRLIIFPLILVGWIQIGNEKLKKVKKFMFSSAGFSLLRAEGFSRIRYWLECRFVMEDKEYKNATFYNIKIIFSRCKTLQFLFIKTLGPDTDRVPDPGF